MATRRQIMDACQAVSEAGERAEKLMVDRNRQQAQANATNQELQAAVSKYDSAVQNLLTLLGQ